MDEQAAEDRLDLHAEARPGDLAVRNQLVGYFLGEVDRDREARPIAVDKRAAAVSRIDRRVRLNRAHQMRGLPVLRRDTHVPVEGTHDPGRHRAAQPQRRTEGNDRLPDLKRPRLACWITGRFDVSLALSTADR